MKIDPIATVLNARCSEDSRYNQVYFNDFETATGPPNINSKSGYKSIFGGPFQTHTIDKKMIPGSYVLSFWHDSAALWMKDSREFEVESRDAFPQISYFRTGYIDDVCIIPPNAVVFSYVHIPGVGETSQTDVRGRYISTQYNGLGLPESVVDKQGPDLHKQIVKKYEYQ